MAPDYCSCVYAFGRAVIVPDNGIQPIDSMHSKLRLLQKKNKQQFNNLFCVHFVDSIKKLSEFNVKDLLQAEKSCRREKKGNSSRM